MEKIILFGTGKKAEHIFGLLNKLKQFEIVEVWDNEIKNHGKQFKGLIVKEPERQNNYVILVASTYYSEIKANLMKCYGIDEKLIKPWNYCFHYLKNQIIEKYCDSKDTEIQSILRFLETEELDVMNGEFRKKYDNISVQVERDEEKGLFFTYWKGKKMYLAPKFPTKRAAENYVRGLMEEQDKESPHYYGELPGEGKGIVVDVGAAEGFWALDAVDYAEKVIVLEGEQAWLEALRHTFEPYKEKVEIIPKLLVEKGKDNGITISDLFHKEGPVACMKMDIEGAEAGILQSEKKLLQMDAIQHLLVCTYHRTGDAHEIKEILCRAGYRTEFSKGYMFFPYGTEIFPELRRGLIRAEK